MRRRQYIAVTAALATVGLSGCTGESLDADSPTENSTNNPRNEGSDSNPEAVTEMFLQAYANGDTDSQEELLHPRAGVGPREGPPVDLVINETEPMTLTEVLERDNPSISEREIQDENRGLNELLDEIGATDSTFIYYNINANDNSEEGYVLLVRDEGWQIFDLDPDNQSEPESSAPQIAFSFDFSSDNSVTITHGGGDHVESSRLAVEIGGTDVSAATADWNVTESWSGTVETGDRLTVSGNTGTDYAGKRVQVIWTPPAGDTSNIVAERAWPNY